MKVLVTGASGFVGRAVVAAFRSAGHDVRAAVRRPSGPWAEGVTEVVVPDLVGSAHLSAAVAGCDAVAHLAGRAHVFHDRSADPLAEFRRVNVAGTESVLRAAAAGGVSRFLFVSSIKVNGEGGLGKPYRDSDPPAPVDPYGVSKLEAELLAAQYRDQMSVAILRPPLVFGPGVRGNFRRLLTLVDCSRWLPLPLGALNNRRSLVFVGNLASAIVHLLEAAPRVKGTFLVSDGEDLSTTQLFRRTARELDISSLLVPVPARILQTGGRLLGRAAEMHRLTESLTVDIAPLLETGWRPPYSVDVALAETARWWAHGGRMET